MNSFQRKEKHQKIKELQLLIFKIINLNLKNLRMFI